jgi:hypothetical protein
MMIELLRRIFGMPDASPPSAPAGTAVPAAPPPADNPPARVVRIVCPLRSSDFVAEDPLNYRAEYWATYGAFIPRALRTLGIPLSAPAQPADEFAIEWHFDDGRCLKTGFSYSDLYWDFDSSLGMDALFKLRYHPSRGANGRPRIPAAPSGFGLAVSGGYGDNDAFVAQTLPELRRIKDHEAQAPTLFYNAAHFRTIGEASAETYPNRERFRTALGVPRGDFEPAARWLEGVARSAWTLNLCGSGNSIDRKVVELCAIGCAIISDRGLEDLELPNGRRFVHGENIWFVDDPQDLQAVPELVVGDRWRRLIDGSRQIYADCFEAGALGRWYLHNAQAWAARR